jgi:hypothetical protein
MRQNDPIREAARAARDQAQLNLDILCRGIGQSLVETGRFAGDDNVRMLIDRVNTDLAKALEAKEAADKAYEPFWGRRRLRRSAARKPKTEVRKRQTHSHKAPAGDKKSAS